VEWTQSRFTISTDGKKLQLEVIADFLSSAYWSSNRPRALIERSLQHSLNFGLYEADTQIGFARVVTDYATFAYLCDVFVLESHRGHGLGKWLMSAVTEHPDLAHLRRFMLATRDAHGLYAQFGFTELSAPDRWMEKFNP
jgi:GNAT superfamily N-acetyltransferase